jgi:hypothetical protein
MYAAACECMYAVQEPSGGGYRFRRGEGGGGFWPCSSENGEARLSDKTFLMPKELLYN